MPFRFQAVFKSLRCHEVRYLVIGGIAVIFHGIPRTTLDLDILIDATMENARRLLDALTDAGLQTARLLDPADLLSHDVTIFSDFIRVDVQTNTPGLVFADAWSRKKSIRLAGDEVFFLCQEDLIAAKRATGREVDLRDVALLEENHSD